MAWFSVKKTRRHLLHRLKNFRPRRHRYVFFANYSGSVLGKLMVDKGKNAIIFVEMYLNAVFFVNLHRN
jgi:hypothetical protein